MTKRSNSEVIVELLDLQGKRVLDVGCGDGSLARLMTREGATVLGIESGAGQLERARAAEKAGDETYAEGKGEDMPADDGSADVVVFSNSLHHVAPEYQAKALAEADRVLKPGGVVCVSEPLAEGAHFELQKPVHDETEARASALKAIKGAAGLVEEKEITYTQPVRHAGYLDFRDRMCAINPHCVAIFEERDGELRANFERIGEKAGDGYDFDQPMRVNVLRKR